MALFADGVRVEAMPDVSADDLLGRAAACDGADLVWLACEDTDDVLVRELTSETRTSEGSPRRNHAQVDVEVVVGSVGPAGSRLLELVEVMDRLRRECPWDREQNHASLVRYLVEETYETVDAIESGDRDHLCEELGDLLLQVLFHARIASEHPEQPFDVDDVADAITQKLIRRHPHVFSDASAEDVAAVERNWASIKAAEKARRSPLDGIPLGLPALALADKFVGRCLDASAGLSVPTPAETTYTLQSLGEVLFALVAAAHAAGLDPEQALRARVAREIDQVRGAGQRAARPDDALRS